MRKYIFFTLLMLFFIVVSPPISAQRNNVHGQSTPSFTIKGKVIDNEKEPLPQATIRLLIAKDSSLVSGTLTDMKGIFELNKIRRGNFLIHLTYVGYEELYIPVTLKRETPNLDLGTLTMSNSSIVLAEAEVVGKAPEVIVKQDTVEYNADSFKSQPNAVIEDLIKQLPGVQVDNDGKITAKGKQVKKILVDGKEFFGEDPTVASKNIPTDMVDKLQLVDRKSDMTRLTGVDDGEEELVINLTVKKDKKKGWFGNATAGIGTDNRYLANGMVNYFIGENQYTIIGGGNNTNNQGFSDRGGGMYNRSRGGGGSGINSSSSLGGNFNIGKSEKLRIGGDVIYSHSDNYTEQKTERQNLLQDSTSYSNSNRRSQVISNNLAFNFRMRWEIDSLNTFEFLPRVSLNRSSDWEESNSYTLDQNLDSVNRARSSNHGQSEGLNINTRVSFSHKSAIKAGRQISASLTYSTNISNDTQWNDNNRFFYTNDSVDLVKQEVKDRTKGESYRVDATYIEPLGNNRFLSASYYLRNNTNESDKFAYDLLLENMPLDSAYSNSFRNDFLTQRLNMAFKTVRTKYTYNVGVNVEPSRSKSVNLIDTARSVPARSVVNIAPELYYIYTFEPRHTLRADYRGRTQQPSLSQLQPVRNITNPLYIQLGNPDLLASYNNNITIRYQRYIADKQRSINAHLSANYVFNSIVNQTTYRATGEQITIPVNVNGVWDASGMFIYNTPFTNDKFQFNTFTNITYRNAIGFTATRGSSEAVMNKSGTLSMSENISLNYRSKLFDVGVRGNYRIQNTSNTSQIQTTPLLMNYGGTLDGTIYLPLNFSITTDFSYSGTSGYTAGYDRTQMIWNAHIAAQVFKGKQGTIMLKVYDILQQRSAIMRQVTGNYIQDQETNILTSYAMLSFTYKFNAMGGMGGNSNKREERSMRRNTPSPHHVY